MNDDDEDDGADEEDDEDEEEEDEDDEVCCKVDLHINFEIEAQTLQGVLAPDSSILLARLWQGLLLTVHLESICLSSE